MADWLNLPFDVLYEIVMRFGTIEDFIYFSVVCRLWNHFAAMVKHKFNVQMPWLLLAENTQDDNPDCLRKVYNPYNNKYYQLKLPEIFRCRCWGSAYGSLVTYNQYLDLHLFNPLTRARMVLPPLTSLPYLWGRYFPNPYYRTLRRMRLEFIYKAFVIKVGEDDLIVFLSYYFGWKKLVFAKPGDRSWTSIDRPTEEHTQELSEDLGSQVAEVICRGAEILILYEDTSVGFIKISDLSDPNKLIVRNYLPIPPMLLTDPRNLSIKVREYLTPPPGILDEFDTDIFGSYLVQSCDVVYMVLRDRCYLKEDQDEDRLVYGTFGFMVYKLDFDKKKWLDIRDVGDVALFIGTSASLSIPVIGVDSCESNCIYYTDDFDMDWDKPLSLGGSDMGVFYFEDDDQQEISEGCYTFSKVQTPLWFIPRL